MNAKARKLTNELTQRELMRQKILADQEKFLKDFDEDTNKINERLQKVLNSEEMQKGLKALCNLTTNAIRLACADVPAEKQVKVYKQLLKIKHIIEEMDYTAQFLENQ